MFENVCAIPLDHDLFAQAIHPEEPIVAVGLASGHVQTYRLPPGASDDSDNDATLASENGFGHIETAWKTRRHKGSCRTLAYSLDGAQLYSAGTDGIVKVADSATGQVTAKIAIPLDPANNGIDAPTLVHALSPQSLIVTTDSSALHIYDIRQLGGKSALKPQDTHHPHDDYISSLTPLPATQASTSGFSKQWVTTGGSTLAVTDLRRGVMVRSEDQDEELLTSLIVTGLSTKGTNVGEKVIVGAGNGVLTLWERGVWDDQDERIVVDRSKGGGESLDSMALLPDGVGPGGKIVAVGMGNGDIRFAKIGPNKIVAELKHDELSHEGVIALGFDVSGRMISGGGKTVKVWGEKTWQDVDEDEDKEIEDSTAIGKREHDSDSNQDSDEDMEDSSEEDEPKQKRKKRKRNKGKQQSGHARFRQRADDCNCFLSVDAETLAKTSVFQTATADGPVGVHGQLDEHAQAALSDFIASKKAKHSEQLVQRAECSKLYQPLLDGEVRVLELYPGEPDDPFKGTLHIVSIDFSYPLMEDMSYKGERYTRHTNHAVSLATEKPVWYTALSYVWGAPIFDQAISIEPGFIKITSSLASALRHLRSIENSVILWIDQICMNQPDIAEKVQQIPLMGKIYTNATNTLIWLGDDEDSSSVLAFETMENVHARLQGSDAQVTPEDFGRLHFPPATDRSWWAVKQLLRRPWFTRLWTIQEAFLSRDLFIECGRAIACWDDFAAWCYLLHESRLLQWLTTNDALDREYSKGDPTAAPLPQGATVVNSIQADRIQGLTLVQREYLLNILVSTRYAQATQPKDKIYGVLGMAESNIVADYSPAVTDREVFHEACLTQLPLLIYELLSCVDHDQPLQPSWIPDWGSPRVTEALGYSTKAWTLYCAGGRPVAGQFPKMALSKDKKQVTLAGKMFDTIVTLGCVSQDPKLDIDNPQSGNRELASYVNIVREAIDAQTYHSSETSIYGAFLYTLLAGRDGSGVALPSQDHSEVFSLILDSTTGHMHSLPGQIYSPRRQKGFFTLNSLRSRKPAKTLEDLRTALRAALKMRRFVITRRGYFALVPRGAKDGDEVVVFDRACVPFVVRKTLDDAGNTVGYKMLGEAYVHGIMKGEVMAMDDVKLEDVTLV
ncbi:WD40 repeat-like protein [Cucurbitaria berberidis CBS 394.84]|uniref:WD40 repeat-like protein n=1 Tax=Cucurbitaria berberidis CBS 394.84 TaxID=1168544 RepID=A0A9P4G9C7_9PLEO|nr:WD40 repeat-like protein [Cucurbitaria berberidis CBS 394.84]KAF1841543.1 WD40 repeat-like protein [Cucurbitaria berberidis CBS 394.84]